jgi:predicted enzyme related to lactoylglutathione lyase
MPERTEYPDGEPCWADVVTPDLDAGCRFYEAVFGWTFTGSGPEFGNYTMCHKDGKLVAGITPPPPGDDGSMPPMWNLYLASANVDETAGRIEQGGGKILMAPMDVPGSGRMAYALDPTGAAIGVWQSAGMFGAQLTAEPGTPCWAELSTRDGVAADAFYRGLFGYEQVQVGDGENFDYSMWKVGEREVAGRQKATDESTPSHWAVYFAVDDADAAAQRATDNGGRLTYGPDDSPYGRIVGIADPQGAQFYVIDLARRTT